MMRKLSLLVAAVCMCVAANAQRCGFDQAHNNLLSNSPKFANKVHKMDSSLAAYIAANANALIINSGSGPVYEIPVVIHVMHTGGSVGTIYNPSDAALNGMITTLNQMYKATYASFPGPTGGGTAFPVQFALAKRDANCNATTTGIDRVNAVAAFGGSSSTNGSAYISDGVIFTGTSGVADATLKALALWNNNDYYNIWVVNKIDGADGTVGTFTAGYAYFPGAASNIDGTVILATQCNNTSTTLTHEIGHAFSLYHTFQGDGTGSTCPTNTNCNTDGDRVCDTEPHQRTTNCTSTSATNPCTSNPYGTTVRNIMDYTSCPDRLTSGQRTRWMSACTTSRLSLLSSLGAITLGTAPAFYNCTPTANNPFNSFDAGISQTQILDPSQSAPYNILMTAMSEGGYNSDGNSVYVDRACWQRANMTAGSSYTIRVSTGINSEKVRAYIDWNNDGVFNTSTELVFSSNTTGSYQTHVGTITVPSSGITTCVPIRMRVVSDLNSAAVPPTPCGGLDAGQAEDYSVLIKSAPPSVISVSQTTGSNPSCNGSTIGFTATYTGSPTSPSVKMYVNGVQVATTNTYTSSSFNNGDIVTAKLFFTGGCGADSVSSSGFIVTRSTTVTPTVSIAVTSGSNPGCAGQPITFTATPTNGGTNPTYQWRVNGVNVTGATANTFSTSTLACNSTVQVVMTSNSTCASSTIANSNIISYTCGTQAVGASIAVTGGSNPTCSGRNVTFTATATNGGSAPAWQWFLNGTAVTGATGVNFTTNVLNNGDSVHVILTSNYSCATTPTAKSPAIYMSVIPTVTPSVTKAITIGSNPGCIGDAVQFTATPANAGTAAPTYRWFLNGNPIPFAFNPTYTTSTTTTGDRIWVRIIVSSSASSCFTKDTAYSDTTVMDRRTVPNLPLISFIGHQLVSDSANVQWWGPAGIIPGATGPYYTPNVQGDYYAVVIGPICGTGKSNVLTISPLSIGNYNMAGVSITPNPTTGLLQITWNQASTTRLTVYSTTGKALMHEVADKTTKKVLDLSALPSGVYFVMLQDEAGKTGAVRILVQH